MVSKELFGAETRLFIGGKQSKWDEVSKYCLTNNKYLIVTPCINRNDGSGHYPSDTEWIAFIDSMCQKLRNWGANRNNCRISLVNEPMKFCTREQYKHLIDLAYPIVHGHGFLCGAGNEEFLTAQAKGNMYQYILANCKFDILDVHIQGSCDNKEKTEFWCNKARSWTTKQIDCPEAFYADIAKPEGWSLLKTQLNCAENILGCQNFGNVFNNLDTTMFPFNTSGWHKLCFKINGVFRNETTKKYWNEWVKIAGSKAPIPNIIEGEEDMKLDTIYKEGSKGIGVKFIQKVLNEDIKPEPLLKVDGIWGIKTNAVVLKYQEKYNLSQYGGAIGPNTMQDMIKQYPDIWDNIQYLWAIGVRA
jgi:hypothetical protein